MMTDPDTNSSQTAWWKTTIEIPVVDYLFLLFLSYSVDARLLMTPEALEHPQLEAIFNQAFGLVQKQSPQHNLSKSTESQWRDQKQIILHTLAPLYKAHREEELMLAVPVRPQQNEVRQPYNTPDTPRAGSEPQQDPEDSDQYRRSTSVSTPQNQRSTPGGRKRQRSETVGTGDPKTPGEKNGKRARGPQSHACVTCGKVFPFLSKLHDHEKTHSPAKNLSCPYCNKSFKRVREVNAHLKSVHKVELSAQQLKDIITGVLPMPPSMSPVPPVMTAMVPGQGGQGGGLPPTPAGMPTTPAYSLPPPTPKNLAPPPRPSPRMQFQSPYTPGPTPENFAPTPGDDYGEDAYTPRTTIGDDPERSILISGVISAAAQQLPQPQVVTQGAGNPAHGATTVIPTAMATPAQTPQSKQSMPSMGCMMESDTMAGNGLTLPPLINLQSSGDRSLVAPTSQNVVDPNLSPIPPQSSAPAAGAAGTANVGRDEAMPYAPQVQQQPNGVSGVSGAGGTPISSLPIAQVAPPPQSPKSQQSQPQQNLNQNPNPDKPIFPDILLHNPQPVQNPPAVLEQISVQNQQQTKHEQEPTKQESMSPIVRVKPEESADMMNAVSETKLLVVDQLSRENKDKDNAALQGGENQPGTTSGSASGGSSIVATPNHNETDEELIKASLFPVDKCQSKPSSSS
ncbi:hypothetical protein BZA77DRAFT_167963 [Pyronema omphalodes]|nr:hypothetical protein BZA77DRAFT_167963 [Pyronema omphalodes]